MLVTLSVALAVRAASERLKQNYLEIYEEECDNEIKDIYHDQSVKLGRAVIQEEVEAYAEEYEDQLIEVVRNRARERFLTEYPEAVAFTPPGFESSPLSMIDEMHS